MGFFHFDNGGRRCGDFESHASLGDAFSFRQIRGHDNA